ncbi:MAG: hypothetical protein CMH57_08345 [Myxococcales bacterium]|nr:hypothetical protein [Myxococcales bacterium]
MALLLGVSLSAPSVAQDTPPKARGEVVKLKPHQREILIKERRFRFAVPKSWSVREAQGIYTITSDDHRVLMITVLLDKPQEVPQALAELDKMVVITGAEFSEPWNSLQGAIPVEYRAGAGTMQPSGRPVELLMTVMNVVNRPVLTMFYVHKEAYKAKEPDIKEILKSFAVVLTPRELEELRKSMPQRPDKANP